MKVGKAVYFDFEVLLHLALLPSYAYCLGGWVSKTQI